MFLVASGSEREGKGGGGREGARERGVRDGVCEEKERGEGERDSKKE